MGGFHLVTDRGGTWLPGPGQRTARRRPEWIGRRARFQVAVPSREGVPAFERLKEQIHQPAGDLNSRRGTPSWRPLGNLKPTRPLPELVGRDQASDACLGTPLRDGMNHVAKECGPCREDGPVVLPESAGAALDRPGAIPVHPFSPEHAADGLHAALTRKARERRRRSAQMRRICRSRDRTRGRKTFLRRRARV